MTPLPAHGRAFRLRSHADGYDAAMSTDTPVPASRCVSCESGSGRRYEIFELDGAVQLWRCGSCGTESWVATRPDERAPDASEYWDLQRLDTYVHAEVVAEYFDRYEHLLRFAGLRVDQLDGLRLADWGGGIGNLASWLRDRGATDVTVLDTDRRALDSADGRGLRTLLVDEVDDNECFDVIFAIDVIEHVMAAGSFLEILRGHLVDGGRLVLETPNSRFYLREPARRQFPPKVGPKLRHFLYYYEHKHYFTTEGLCILADRAGFEVTGVMLAGSPRSKIAGSVVPGTSRPRRVLRSLVRSALMVTSRRNKIWMTLESTR